jgi:KUP system potassium uptake protein
MSEPVPESAEPPSQSAAGAPPTSSLNATKTGTHGALPSGTYSATNRSPHRSSEPPTGKRLAVLSLTALGVVYGDIGTSPLYALKECFGHVYGLLPTPENVYGILSLVFWALTLVISGKYVTFILRADNRGEGGTLSLLALIFPRRTPGGAARTRGFWLVALALFGAALLYGDGVITPAMSVLGAMEGLEVASPQLKRFVVPLAVIILVGFFALQKHGTDRVGKLFGPVMLVWFTTIAILGLKEIVQSPQILLSVNPWYAVQFAMANGVLAFLVLGSVVLVITGGEALYADMGHFGKRPIRLAWLSFVMPALLINYFGQGALLLRDPLAVANPFFNLAPRWFLYPLLAIATMAAIVASQAMISGAFSLTRTAIQLGFLPRMDIRHTSSIEEGQIYVPEINMAVGVGCILIVLGFQNTSALGAAYGIAVTGTMTITTILFYVVARIRFRWPAWQAGLLCGAFLIIDLAFFGANIVKVMHGGWVPLVLGLVIFVSMLTWKRGRAILQQKLLDATLPLDLFLDDVKRRQPHRVRGSAVVMTSTVDGVPPVLLHHLKHNQVLHQQVVLLSVLTDDTPEVPGNERVEVQELGEGFFRVIAHYGFMQTPDVTDILTRAKLLGLNCRPNETTYLLGRERLIPTGPAKLSRWRKQLFVVMSRNARSATEFFGLPSNRVVELGTQIEF